MRGFNLDYTASPLERGDVSYSFREPEWPTYCECKYDEALDKNGSRGLPHPLRHTGKRYKEPDIQA